MSAVKYDRKTMQQEIGRVLNDKLSRARVKLRFLSPYVGGQPASRSGIEAFAQHHLGLKPDTDDFTEAVDRMLGEEVRLDQAGDELTEKASYGLNVIRRTSTGAAFIGTWQVRAMLKQSASRLGLFQAAGKVGSKGDLAEGMIVAPAGASENPVVDEARRFQQIVITQLGRPFTDRQYDKFMGSVTSPSGRKSIVHDSEVAPPGCEIEFVIEWPTKRLKPRDMAAILGFGERIGLGSVKSLESGRFEVVELEIESGSDE